MKKVSFLIMALLLFSFSANGGLYRWVDENGNVSYSDRVPQTAVRHGHVELNDQGLKKKVNMSASQKAELAAIIAEREQEEKEKAEKQKQAAIARIQDDQLLAVYSNRNELITVFENKIQMSRETNKILKRRHQILSERMAKTEIKHEKMKNSQFKKTLEGKIDDMLDGLKVYQQAITENMIEQNKLEEDFNNNLVRFDKLMKQEKIAEKKRKKAREKELQKLANQEKEEEASMLDKMRSKLKGALNPKLE